jgi:hypothetical protein
MPPIEDSAEALAAARPVNNNRVNNDGGDGQEAAGQNAPNGVNDRNRRRARGHGEELGLWDVISGIRQVFFPPNRDRDHGRANDEHGELELIQLDIQIGRRNAEDTDEEEEGEEDDDDDMPELINDIPADVDQYVIQGGPVTDDQVQPPEVDNAEAAMPPLEQPAEPNQEPNIAADVLANAENEAGVG